MKTLTQEEIAAILRAGAGGFTGADGTIYNTSTQGNPDGSPAQQFFHKSKDGYYDTFDPQGNYLATDKQGNGSNDMGKFLLSAAAMYGGAALGGGLGGTENAVSQGLSSADKAALFGNAGYGGGAELLGGGGSELLAGAGAAGSDVVGGGGLLGNGGGFNLSDAFTNSLTDAVGPGAGTYGALGTDVAAGLTGGTLGGGLTGGGGGLSDLLGGLNGSDLLKYGGALAGAISGAKGVPGASQTTKRELDPRLDSAVFGPGGLLQSETDWFNKNKATGMNQQMTDATQWQRGLLSDPRLTTGLYTQGGAGLGLLQRPVAGNPFADPRFNGKFGG